MWLCWVNLIWISSVERDIAIESMSHSIYYNRTCLSQTPLGQYWQIGIYLTMIKTIATECYILFTLLLSGLYMVQNRICCAGLFYYNISSLEWGVNDYIVIEVACHDICVAAPGDELLLVARLKSIFLCTIQWYSRQRSAADVRASEARLRCF